MFQRSEHPGTIVQIHSNLSLAGLPRCLSYPMIFLERTKINTGMRKAMFLAFDGTVVDFILDSYRYYDIRVRGTTYSLIPVAI